MLSAETHWGNRQANGEESSGRSLYNRHRYYSPEIGRYISADPIGQYGITAFTLSGSLVTLGAGPNVYQYAFGNPTGLTDPTGTAVPIVVALVATAKALGYGTAAGVAGATLGFGLAGALDALFGGGNQSSTNCPPNAANGNFFSKNAGPFADALGNVVATNAAIATVTTGTGVAIQAGPIVTAAAVANSNNAMNAAAVAAAAIDPNPGGATPTAQAANALVASLQGLRNQIRQSFGQ